MAFNSYTGVNIPFTASNKQFIKSMQEAKGALGGFVAESSIGLTNAYSQMDRMQRQIQSGIGRTADSIKNFGKGLTTYLTLPMSLGGAGSLAAYFDLDAMAKGLDVVTGSTQRTATYMKQFLKDAAMPGLGYKEVVQHGNSWLILGDNIQVARKKMQEFGNALALEGKGKDVFATVNYQLIQMANKGKVMAEDLKPILNASAVIAKTISDRYKTTDSGDIQKALEKQGIGSKQFIDQLVTDLSKLDRVVGGAKNSWENFTDSLFIAAAAVGEFIDKGTGFQSIMDMVGNALRKGAEYLNEMPLAWKQVISSMAMAALVAGPLLTVFGSLIKVFVGFSALGQVVTLLGKVQGLLMAFAATNPATVGIMAVAAAFGVLALAVAAYRKESNVAAEAQKNMVDIKRGAILDAKEEHKVLDGLVAVARDKKKEDWERAAAIKKLNEYAPEYLGNLTQENINTKAIVDQLKNYKIYILAKIQYDAIATELSLKSQDVLRLKKLNPEKNIGFLDYMKAALLGQGNSGLDVAKYRLKGEINDAIIGKNAAFNDFKDIERKVGLLERGLVKTKVGGLPVGGTANKPSGYVASMADIEMEQKTQNAIKKANQEWEEIIKKEEELAKKHHEAWGKLVGMKSKGVSNSNNLGAYKDYGDNLMQKFTDKTQADWNKNLEENFSSAFGTVVNGFQDLSSGVANGMAEFAEAWTNGTFKWKNVGDYFSTVVGDMLITSGKALFAKGSLDMIVSLLPKGVPNAAIAGLELAYGTAAIVAGGALKGLGSRGGGSGSSIGSVGGYSSPTYSGTGGGSTGGGSQALKIDLNLSGNFRIAGSDLVLAISRQTTLNANR